MSAVFTHGRMLAPSELANAAVDLIEHSDGLSVACLSRKLGCSTGRIQSVLINLTVHRPDLWEDDNGRMHIGFAQRRTA